MPVVVRAAGFSVRVLTTGEHAPPHVHVFKAGAECRILWDIKGGSFSNAQIRRAVALVAAHLDACNANGGRAMGMDDHLTDADIAAARERGRQSLQDEPHAHAVAYLPATRQVRLDLTNGLVLLIPVAGIKELVGATADQLASCEVLGVGSGISWPDLDVDISVFGLVLHWTLGADWRRRIRQELGREVGRLTSDAKAAAARSNGKKGGRPRKTVAEVPTGGAVRRHPASE